MLNTGTAPIGFSLVTDPAQSGQGAASFLPLIPAPTPSIPASGWRVCLISPSRSRRQNVNLLPCLMPNMLRCQLLQFNPANDQIAFHR